MIPPYFIYSNDNATQPHLRFCRSYSKTLSFSPILRSRRIVNSITAIWRNVIKRAIRVWKLRSAAMKSKKNGDGGGGGSSSSPMALYCPKNRPASEKCLEELKGRYLYVWLRTSNPVDQTPYWYKICPYQNQEEEEGKLLQPPPLRFYQKMGYGLAVCGSKIYSMGGAEIEVGSTCFRGKDDIWVYDTEATHPEWKQHPTCPKMPQIRSHPVVVVVGDKIYVFGSNFYTTPRPDPWAEVFDTKSGKWEKVVNVPQVLVEQGCVDGFVIWGDEIFIECGNDLLSYNVEKQLWKNIGKEYPAFVSLDRGGAIVDDVCYIYYSPGCIAAYDLKLKIHTTVDVLGKLRTEYMWLYPGYGNVHQFGKDILCLVCTVQYPPSQTFLICVAFRVSKINSGDAGKLNIRSEIISIQSYLVEGRAMISSIAL